MESCHRLCVLDIGRLLYIQKNNKSAIYCSKLKWKILCTNSSFVVPTTDGKLIEEHHGVAATNNQEISIAHMIAPPKWSEPFQTPEFEEYTYIIKGKKQFSDEIIISKQTNRYVW
jgi:hypothetical protein